MKIIHPVVNQLSMKPDRSAKKERVSKRINKLDPNNNKNLEDHKKVIRNGKKAVDDGFEHRKSSEGIA
jgi:hypothetical protein